MQAVTTGFLAALTGSPSYRVQVDAWRGGALIGGDIPVQDCTITRSIGRGSTCDLTVADPDGLWSPRKFTDPLAPYGSELQVRVGVEVGQIVEFVSLGWWVIQSAESVDRYGIKSRPAEPGRALWVSRGSLVDIKTEDRAKWVSDARFIAREQPAAGNVFDEINRLCQGARVPWRPPTGVSNANIPGDVTYQDDRYDAISTLAALVDAVVDVTPDGAITLRPSAPPATVPVWTLTPSQQADMLVTVRRRMARADLYNTAVSRGQVPDGGAPLQAVRQVGSDSPMDPNGPFRSKPYFHAANFLTTQAAVDADAATTLARVSTRTQLLIPVSCVPNPALELGDCVALPAPRGQVLGTVAKISLTVPAVTMDLDVSVDPLAYGQVA